MQAHKTLWTATTSTTNKSNNNNNNNNNDNNSAMDSSDLRLRVTRAFKGDARRLQVQSKVSDCLTLTLSVICQCVALTVQLRRTFAVRKAKSAVFKVFVIVVVVEVKEKQQSTRCLKIRAKKIRFFEAKSQIFSVRSSGSSSERKKIRRRVCGSVQLFLFLSPQC